MVETDAESVRTESQGGEEPHLTELSTGQLRELTRNISNALETLKAETEIFQKFSLRLDPKELSPPAATSDTGAPTLDFQQMRSRRRSKSRSALSERLLTLSSAHKMELLQRELEECREEGRRHRESAERTLQGLKASMEEAELRSGEVRKARYEFERDVGKEAVIGRRGGGGVSPEKILRYMEERTRARDGLVDKLRLKNAALKIQKKKLQLQLKQKEEVGEVLSEVDFQQLRIENSQFLERIDQRNHQLLQLKLHAGDTLQLLNSYKKKLQHSMEEAGSLGREAASRREMLQRIEQETQQVEQEREKAESLNRKLRRQLGDFQVPDVLQYVQGKMEQEELLKRIRAWERKVEIAELSVKTQRRSWEQLKATYAE